jgi:hypothetical protein
MEAMAWQQEKALAIHAPFSMPVNGGTFYLVTVNTAVPLAHKAV